MKDLISIIIPVYNTEKYLKKCLTSVLKQTYDNLEIIIIDDGSTDNSLDICRSYEVKDSRIKLYHQENKGVSYTRNFGLSVSTGDYVLFVDSDDWINDNMCELLLKSIYENNSDIAICEYIRHYDVDDNEVHIKYNISKDESFQNVILNPEYEVFGYLPTKLLKKNVIRHNFYEDIYYSEDLAFLLDNFFEKKYSIVNEPLYVYNINCNSALNAPKFNLRRLSILKVDKKIFSLNLDLNLKYFYNKQYEYHFYTYKYYLRKYKLNNDIIKEYEKDMELIQKFYTKNHYTKDRIKFNIKKYLFNIYYWLRFVKELVSKEYF